MTTRWLIDIASHIFYALILLLALIAGMMVSATPAAAHEADILGEIQTKENPYWSVEDFNDYFCTGIDIFAANHALLNISVPLSDPDMQVWFREEFDLFVQAANVQVVGTPPRNVDCPAFHTE